MSKQYLLAHDSTDPSTPTITFALTSTPRSILLANSLSTIAVHSTLTSSFPRLADLPAHKTGCHHIVSSANGLRAVSIGFSGDVRVWLNSTAAHEAQATPGADANDAEDDWKLEVTDGASLGDKIRQSLTEGDYAWAPALNEDGSLLALGCPSGVVHSFSLPSARHTGTYSTHPTFTLAVALSPPFTPSFAHDPHDAYASTRASADGNAAEAKRETLLAVAQKSGSITLFSTLTSRLAATLPWTPSPVRTLTFSPHGTLLAAAGDSTHIHLYDPHTGEQVALLRGHTSWIFSLSFSRTGEYLVSGAWDGKVKVWRVETRECVCTISEGAESIWAVEFLRDDGRRRGMGRVEGFAAGGKGGVRFYREAAGGS